MSHGDSRLPHTRLITRCSPVVIVTHMKRLAPLTCAAAGVVLFAGSVAYAANREVTPSPTATTTITTSPTDLPTTTPMPAPSDVGDSDSEHEHNEMEHDSDAHEHMDHDMDDMDSMEDMEDMGGMGGGHGHGVLAPLDERRADATPEEEAAADALWADTRAAVARYENIDNAIADGFAANPSQVGETTIHYPHRANRRDDLQLDPEHPEGLVYRHNPDGSYTLLGTVFTAKAGEPAPTPGGPMFSWHTHQDCGDFFVPAGECTDTFRMLHVWTAPEVVDPFTQPFGRATGRI